MQNPKASRNGSVGVPQGMSQTSQKSSPSTNRTHRQVKVARYGSNSEDSPNLSSRTPRNRSPKVLERGSPQSSVTEKKRLPKLSSDLESQRAQLEDELKKTKEQLTSSETLKGRAIQEGEEMKRHLVIMSARLKESEQQLHDISISEDDRIQELRKLSQERDQVWQSEVEAIQKQHSMDLDALSSALNEIQKLKKQLEMASNSNATHSRHLEGEIERLRFELSGNVSLVEDLRKQVSDCEASQAQALKVDKETQMQLEEAITTAESLRSEGVKSKEAYNCLALELEKSKEKASSLEMLVMELEEKLQYSTNKNEKEEDTETIEVKAELDALKLEASQLKSALVAAELRYDQEYIQSTLQVRNAFDQVERTKSEIVTLEAELQTATSTIDELKSKLEENERNSEKSQVETELKIVNGDLQDLKAVLVDKETQIQSKTEENDKLKTELQKRENNEGSMSATAAELEAAQKEKTELETELKKLKVQSDQWRKAAEAAAAMLSTGSIVDHTVSFDSIAVKMESPLSDDIDDDSPKKRNGNMLKKFGVLWKKGHK